MKAFPSDGIVRSDEGTRNKSLDGSNNEIHFQHVPASFLHAHCNKGAGKHVACSFCVRSGRTKVSCCGTSFYSAPDTMVSKTLCPSQNCDGRHHHHHHLHHLDPATCILSCVESLLPTCADMVPRTDDGHWASRSGVRLYNLLRVLLYQRSSPRRGDGIEDLRPISADD